MNCKDTTEVAVKYHAHHLQTAMEGEVELHSLLSQAFDLFGYRGALKKLRTH